MAVEAVFGHYRLLALLGQGGMGEVWRAVDTRKQREVAVKVLGAWLAGEPGYAARFRREAALAARLNAPNIIPIHDYGEIDDRLFIEMPLIVGTDLNVLLARQGRFDPVRAVDVIDQVAAALDTAHTAGLVHRDVKPSNVLVTTHRGRGFVYLIDFGIAHAADGTHITTTGREVGTLAYMAPERFEGAGDARGDVYALACVLYETLTGQAPFVPPEQTYPFALYLNAHLHRPPPKPSVGVPPLAAAWDEVIARGMAKDPEQRYPSAGELAAAAQAILTAPRPNADRARKPGIDHGAPPVRPLLSTEHAARPNPSVRDASRSGFGPRYAAHTASEVGAAGTPTALTALSSPASETTTSRPPAGHLPLPPPLSTPPRTRRPPRCRLLILLAALVLVVVGTAIALTWIRPPSDLTTRAAPIVERQLTGHTGPVLAVATAQLDGRPVLVSGSNDQTVRVWDLATGQPIGAPFTGHVDPVLAVATAQLSGRPVVITGGWDRTVRVWDLATGQQVAAPFTGHFDGVGAVATAQLNGHPVVISGSDDHQVRVSDLATGQQVGVPFTGHAGAVLAVATAELNGRPVVISGSNDHTVRVWDLATGQPIGAPFTGHTDTVRALATTQLDGRPVVVSGGDDQTVRVWDLATGQPIGAPFTGHMSVVRGLATAELNGRAVVISGSDDQTVRVWDLATGQPIGAPFKGHTDGVRAVATTQLDGRPVVISGSWDKTLRVWDLAARAHS